MKPDVDRRGGWPQPPSPRLRVLVVHNLLWTHYRGALYSELYAQALAAEVQLEVAQIAASERRRLELGEVDGSLHRYPYLLLNEGAYEDDGLWTRTRKLLATLRPAAPDVVVLPGYDDPASWALLAAARRRGARVMLPCDSTASDRPGGGLRGALKRRIVASCDGFISFSEGAWRYLRALGAPAERIWRSALVADNAALAQLHASADRQRQRAALGARERNLIYVGRFGEEKNLPALLAAYATLDDPTWGLLLVGAGPLEATLRAQAERLALQGLVFVGGRGWREVPALFAAADALVLPSRSEPWGLVVNEALACGLPAIVSERCGAAELIDHGVNGWRFEPDEPEALPGLLRQATAPATDLAAMGAAGRAAVAELTPARAAAMMLEALIACAEGRRAGE